MFFIVELQTNDGVSSHIVSTESDLNSALSAYHNVLHYAAVSNNDIHACVVLDETGGVIARDSFTHPKTTSEPEEE